MSPVSFQIVSDLHLETHPSYDDFDLSQSARYLALLGDIGHISNDGLFAFIERQLSRYSVVFYLLGNHEPYHLRMERAKQKVRTFADRMSRLRGKSKSATMGEFVFLDQTRYDLANDVTVLGCTLYSRVTPEQARAVSSRVVDFKDIVAWDVSEHVDAHLSDLDWLNAQVAEISRKEPQRQIAIFTHHSPCADQRANDPRHKHSEVTSGFVTDLKDEKCWKNPSVVLWAFGHTHFNCDFVDEKGKRVVANQKGYYSIPQATFDASKVVTVGRGC